MSGYWSLPLQMLGITAITAMGLQLILGGAGLLSLGHAAFFAVGAYSSASFVVFAAAALGLTHPAAQLAGGMLTAVAVCGVLSAAVAAPCLRLRGDYLAAATLGLSQITENTLYNLPIVGGASGFSNVPKLVDLPLIWLCVACTAVGLHRFYQTHVGLGMLCARDDEWVAQSFGIWPWRARLYAFVLGNMVTGIAGALFVHTFAFVSPSAAGFAKSIEVLLAVVVGGMYSLRGSLLGAALLVGVPEALRFLPEPLAAALQVLVARELLPAALADGLVALSHNAMLLFAVLVLVLLRFEGSSASALWRYLRRGRAAA